MPILLLALVVYGLGMVLTAIGSRLAGRCVSWCCALCGLPMWVVGGTVAPLCLALPQLMLAFFAAGMSLTSLAVGAALAGAVTDLGLVLGLCLLRRDITVKRREFCTKCMLLLIACLVLVLFVRDGALSFTGIGLLMAIFVLFVLHSIGSQYYYLYETDADSPILQGISEEGVTADEAGTAYSSDTMQFPHMSLASSMKNLVGVVGGIALLGVGAGILLYSVAVLTFLTATTQALWAATLISLGFCLPLLAEVLHHPFGSIWKKFAIRCRFYPPAALPMQMLNSAILNLTLVLPISTLMYRQRLPIGSQYRVYDVPICIALAVLMLLPPLLKKRLYRWQGVICLVLYAGYLSVVLLAPLAGA